MAWTTTEIVAWWGAVLSTVVFIWDIIKWRLAGPKLRLAVNCNRDSFNMPEYEGKTLIVADVINYGDRPTTLTHMAFVHYPNIWKRIRCRAEMTRLILMPNTTFPLPHELKPGKMWNGIAFQDELFAAIPPGGYFVCEISHTHSKRPLRKRVMRNESCASPGAG